MNTDLTPLREEERAALGYDLQSLWLAVDVPDIVRPLPPFPLEMDESTVSAIQKWIKGSFATLFSEKIQSLGLSRAGGNSPR
jgi:hypothetical protein